MIGATQLDVCGTHAGRGKGVTAIDHAAGLVAVGQRQGPTLLCSDGNLSAVIELPLNGRASDGAAALAFSVAGDVLLLGSASGGLYRLCFSAHGTQLEERHLEARPSPISAIVRQEASDMFAVASGRCIYVVDASGMVRTKIAVSESVLQLGWVGGTTLICCTAGAIHTWPDNGTQLGCRLANNTPSPYLSFATSPDSRFLAVVTDNKEVQCWELDSVLQSDATKGLDPVRLGDYEAQVECLEWDPASRYLATSDGPDVVIWDMSEGGGGGKASSIACCGHDPKTRVVRLAFQPEGGMLATASDGGRIVLYNVKQFWTGGVVGPAAGVQLEPTGDEVTALCWLPGSRLVAGTASGRVAVYMVAAEEASPVSSPRPEASAEARAAAVEQHAAPGVASPRTRKQGSPHGAAAEVSQEEAAGSFAQMSLEGRQPRAVRTSAPRPAQAPQQPPGGQPAYPPVAFAAGMGPAAVGLPMGMPPQFAPPQAYYGPGGRPAGPGGNGNGGQRRRQQGQGQGPPQGPVPAPGYPRGYEAGPYPRTPPSSRSDYAGPPPWQQQPGSMGGRAGQGPGGRAGNGGPMSPDQQQGRSPFAPLVSAGSGPLRSPAGGNGDRNGGRRGGQGWSSGGGGGGGGGQAQYGMSTSLMQHIQAVRDNPTGRGDSQPQRRPQPQPQLAGWGAGSPGGVAAMPWMMVMPPPGSPATGVPPGSGAMPVAVPAAAMAFPTSPAQAQAYAAQYHAAMVQRMAQGGQPVGTLQFVPASGMPPSPRSPSAGSPLPPGGPPVTGMPMLAPPGQWVPVMQQQPGQWPGSGPAQAFYSPAGYVAFSAPAATASPAYMAAAMQAMGMQQPLSPTAAGNGRRGPRQQQAPPLPSPTALPEGPGGRTRRGPRRQGSAGMPGQQLQQEEPLREQEAEGEEEEQQSVHAAAAAAAAAAAVAAAPSPHTPASLPGPDAPAGARPKPQRLEKRGTADSGALLEAAGSCGTECVLSPTAVAGGGDSASMTTPGGSAGDVSVQSTQRGSFDGPVSPLGRTSPRVALGSTPVPVHHLHGGGAPLRQASRGLEDTLPPGRPGAHMGHMGSGSVPGSPVSPGEGVTTVYVGNLPGAVDEYALGCTFAHFGPVLHVQVIRDKATQQSKGFGFVTFAHPAYATLAMQQMDGQVLFGPFGGLKIKVAPSKQGGGGGPLQRGYST